MTYKAKGQNKKSSTQNRTGTHISNLNFTNTNNEDYGKWT